MSPLPFEELGGCDSATRVMSPFPGQWVKDTLRGRSRPPAGSQGGHADRTAHPQGSASGPPAGSQSRSVRWALTAGELASSSGGTLLLSFCGGVIPGPLGGAEQKP